MWKNYPNPEQQGASIINKRDPAVERMNMKKVLEN